MKKLQDNRIDVSSFVDNFCLLLGDENITVADVKADYLTGSYRTRIQNYLDRRLRSPPSVSHMVYFTC